MAASWVPSRPNESRQTRCEGISKGRVTFIISTLGALRCICYSKTYINRVKPHWPGELFAHLFMPTLILSLIWLRTCVTNPYSVRQSSIHILKKDIYLGPQNACDPYLFKMTSGFFCLRRSYQRINKVLFYPVKPSLLSFGSCLSLVLTC